MSVQLGTVMRVLLVGDDANDQNLLQRHVLFIMRLLGAWITSGFPVILSQSEARVRTWVMAGEGPEARLQSVPELAQGQLRGHLWRCRSRERRSREAGWSTAAPLPSAGRSARDPYVESLLAGTRVLVLQAGRPSAGPPGSGSRSAEDALRHQP